MPGHMEHDKPAHMGGRRRKSKSTKKCMKKCMKKSMRRSRKNRSNKRRR